MSEPLKTSTTAPEPVAPFPIDVEAARREFPILDVCVGGKPLVYLDNAATTHKPQAVIETVQRFYMLQNANIHRGVHYLSQQATDAYELAREKIARFFGAASADEIIFVRGTTEAINLVASSWGNRFVGKGDEIVLSEMEHHSNIVPWQLLAERVGATIRVAPITDDGELDMDAFRALLSKRTKIVSIVHVSNALGSVNPVREIVKAAHSVGAKVLVDGAQSSPHMAVDVQEMGCDFFACSGHKMYSPTGIGILYGRAEVLESMPPYHGGGDMIQKVAFEGSTYKAPPGRFEAGTPNISGTVALGAAVDFLERLGRDHIAAHEANVTTYAEEKLAAIEGLNLIGTPKHRAGAISFTLDDVHPHDIGTILDGSGIAIRAGHHCAQPLMRRLGVPATARASFGLYNTRGEVDALVEALGKVRKLFV